MCNLVLGQVVQEATEEKNQSQQASIAEQPRGRSGCATEVCKRPFLDGLWMYGVTLSSGRMHYGYRNKYALGLWPPLSKTDARPVAFPGLVAVLGAFQSVMLLAHYQCYMGKGYDFHHRFTVRTTS